jgi:hypothetical protein
MVPSVSQNLDISKDRETTRPPPSPPPPPPQQPPPQLSSSVEKLYNIPQVFCPKLFKIASPKP